MATAYDSDGSIVHVELWVDSVEVAEDTGSPYAWDWAPALGNHTVQAYAVDSAGARTATSPIAIHVAITPIVREYTYNVYQDWAASSSPRLAPR